MHEYKEYKYKMPITGEETGIKACYKCGTIRVINADPEQNTCSGRMHSNCNVKQLKAVL